MSPKSKGVLKIIKKVKRGSSLFIIKNSGHKPIFNCPKVLNAQILRTKEIYEERFPHTIDYDLVMDEEVGL